MLRSREGSRRSQYSGACDQDAMVDFELLPSQSELPEAQTVLQALLPAHDQA